MRRRVMRWTAAMLVSAAASAAGAAGGERAAAGDPGAIAWRDYHPSVFEASRRDGKPVLINLEAVWCHWCHVMDRTTYADPRVAKLLNRDYLAVKVDHDARPDLADRYRRWGWPATIVIDPAGREVAKRAGYIEPADMVAMLTALRGSPGSGETPSAPPAAGGPARLSPATLAELERRHLRTFDPGRGGLRLAQKFLDADSVELDLALARDGDRDAADRVRRTLDAAATLVDPVWGGAYQYSTHGDWSHPHYEKLMRTQGRYLRVYALAYQQLRDPAYLQVIDAVAGYLADFLGSPEGAFYVSQDADLVQGSKAHDFFALDAAGRSRLGMPRVDRSLYAEANGRAIDGLATAARVTGRDDLRRMAESAARVMLSTHVDAEGAFRHAAGSDAGPFLADNVWMARGLLALHRLSGEPVWREAAARAMDRVDALMRGPAGYRGGVDDGTPAGAVADIDGNLTVARVALTLHERTGCPRYLAMYRHALGYLADPSVALRRITEAGLLLLIRRQAVTNGDAEAGAAPQAISRNRSSSLSVTMRSNCAA